jgi:hypothetical protein
MMRYFFHLRDFLGDLLEDEEGTEFPNLAAARDYATQAMRELLAEVIEHGESARFDMVVVADEDGRHVTSVPVAAPLPATLVSLLKHPAEAVPGNRLDEYRQYADGCRRMADDAEDADDKMSWLKLADAWLHMLPKQSASANLPRWPQVTDEDSKTSH